MEQMQHPRPPVDMNADENSAPAETGSAGMAANNASGHSPLPAKKPGESDDAYGRRLREYYNDQSLGRFPELMLPTVKRPVAPEDNGATGGKVVKGTIYSLAMAATAITWGLPGVIAAYLLLKGADRTLENRKADARNAKIFADVGTGHVHGVRQWLEAGGDPNLANSAGQTLLMMAAATQQDEVARLLLACPDTCVNQACNTGETALHIAAKNNDESMVSLLLKDENHPEINPNAAANNGMPPIFMTTSPAVLSLFVEHPGTDINLRVNCGNGARTRLHRAVAQGSDEEVAALLVHPGIDVNALCSFVGDDWFEITPLHSAIARNHLNIVRMLLADGRVDVNRRGGKGKWSPLNYATSGDRNKNEEIFLALLGHPKVDPNDRDIHNHTPLHHAVTNKMPSFVRALVQHPKIIIDARDNENSYTPLIHAANGGYVACLAELLKHPEIDLSQRTLKGNTPLSAAAIEGYAACVEALVQRMTPEQIELHNNDGRTASEEAKAHMHPDVANFINAVLDQKILDELNANKPNKAKRQKTGAPSPSPSPDE